MDEWRDSEELSSESPYSAKRLFYYVIGAAGGSMMIAFGFPGGGIIGAMIVLGGLNVLFHQEYQFPARLMRLALVGVGATIGLEFSPFVVCQIQKMIIPILGFSFLIVIGSLLIGWVIHHYTHWDLVTCLLGSAPGGLTQMVVVGEEMKADLIKISILQLVRVLTIMSCVPLIAVLVDHL
jgi:membrane AbrB-like protein